MPFGDLLILLAALLAGAALVIVLVLLISAFLLDRAGLYDLEDDDDAARP